MWNFLIVIIIAVIIWVANPLTHFDPKTPLGGVSQKTRNDVNQIQNDAIQQVNQARQLNQQEQNDLNTNQQ